MPTTEEIERYVRETETALEEEKERNRQLQRGQMSLFETPSEDNLIRWQLDLREDLDRIYHLLRGDQVKEDKEGNIVYVEAEDENLKPFNEFGVQLIMNIMAFYLNRNTILSNYKEDVINWKVYDFGNELADLIFNRYEEMGMNTSEKMKMYPMIIKELVDSVHSAYLRAYRGGERESLRTARTVTQSEPLAQRFPSSPAIQPRKFSLWRPGTWRNT